MHVLISKFIPGKHREKAQLVSSNFAWGEGKL